MKSESELELQATQWRKEAEADIMQWEQEVKVECARCYRYSCSECVDEVSGRYYCSVCQHRLPTRPAMAVLGRKQGAEDDEETGNLG
jgi:late competence protein required for DNA uptake (superfamily II DNA/RNA helicase)